MTVELHFTGRRRSALELAVEFVLRDWNSGPIDLRDTLIIVPTRNAGRRLRERLALLAAEKNTAVLSGSIHTPSRLFAPKENSSVPVASDVIAESFMRKVLDSFDKGKLESLSRADFKENPATRSSAAEHMVRLRATVCEENYDFKLFSGKTEHERERWACLASLEQAYRNLLGKYGWQDDVDAKFKAAANPDIPTNVRRVVVLFVPDPPPLALSALKKISGRIPVDICVHAEEGEKALFDEWGLPRPELWQQAGLPLDPSQVEVCDDAMAMAERVRQCVANLDEQTHFGVTVGIGDLKNAGLISDLLERNGVPVFDPSERPAPGLPVFALINRLFQLQTDNRFLSFIALARHPDASRRLEAVTGASSALLPKLDKFQNEHLPLTMEDALEVARTNSASHVVAALEEAQLWLNKVGREQTFSGGLLAALKHIYQDVTDADSLFSESVKLLHGILDRLAHLEALGFARDEINGLFMRMVSSAGLPPERRNRTVQLLGWLELVWDDAPVLLLTDLNDGSVPETLTADPFLPDGARSQLGMRNNAHRMARDAHILKSLLCFTGRKNLRGFMPRRSPDGDPLKPSRLLFRCGPDELPRRVGRFFSDPKSPFASLARSPGWRIRLPTLPKEVNPDHVSPSSLRRYLECPFRFYLEKILGLKDPYEDKVELDVLSFGTVCHDVLKAFADSDSKDSGDEGRIREFLKEETDRLFRERFGRELTLPLMIQKDIIQQRMSAAALVQACLRKDGWQIVESEMEFNTDLAGIRLTGRIDRVDRHAESGRVRVIDYKTSAQAENPSKTRPGLKGGTTAEAYKQSADGHQHWKDLQLPLYIHALLQMEAFAGADIEAAYFVLPNAVKSTDLLVWDGLTSEIVQDAVQCAERMVCRIRAGVFWPPGTGAERREDPTERLFFDDPDTFLDPSSLDELRSRAECWAKGGGL